MPCSMTPKSMLTANPHGHHHGQHVHQQEHQQQEQHQRQLLMPIHNSSSNVLYPSSLLNNPAALVRALMPQPESVFHYKYLREFRVEQCPLFLQHKCQNHRPFTCFHWHFQNQRRRRPVRRRDGTFIYSADIYCTKYDETTGICPDGDGCPYLHRTAGDTERRYHLKYYKTGICVHDTDTRGFCVKNGTHCAFAHGNNDLRSPVYDVRELHAIENGETDPVIGLSNLDRERHVANDDPKWLDAAYVLANYKTEPCQKPPRLCRQGYACPQHHNAKDKRRSPRLFKYRSTPCPNVKSGDEWGDPGNCEHGDTCNYCHTRTEQQFHPEIYKSTRCNDIHNNSYCPRGAFCAFAHVETSKATTNPQAENLHASSSAPSLPSSPSSSSSSLPLPSEFMSSLQLHEPQHLRRIRANSMRMNTNANDFNQQHELGGDLTSALTSTLGRGPPHSLSLRNGSITPPFEENGVAIELCRSNVVNHVVDHLSTVGNSNNVGHLLDQSVLPSMVSKKPLLKETANNEMTNEEFLVKTNVLINNEGASSAGHEMEESGSKSRKSSGFSETLATDTNTNNFGNNGFSNGYSGCLRLGSLSSSETTERSRHDSANSMTTNTFDHESFDNMLPNASLGMFDLTHCSSNDMSKLQEELLQARSKLAHWDANMNKAKRACDAWRKEAIRANDKADQLIRERKKNNLENGQNKHHNCLINKENNNNNNNAERFLHAIKRVGELRHLPPSVLKAIEWQLRRDLQEVEKILREQNELEPLHLHSLLGNLGHNELSSDQGVGNTDWSAIGVINTSSAHVGGWNQPI